LARLARRRRPARYRRAQARKAKGPGSLSGLLLTGAKKSIPPGPASTAHLFRCPAAAHVKTFEVVFLAKNELTEKLLHLEQR